MKLGCELRIAAAVVADGAERSHKKRPLDNDQHAVSRVKRQIDCAPARKWNRAATPVKSRTTVESVMSLGNSRRSRRVPGNITVTAAP